MTQDEKLTLVFGYFASDWQGKKPPPGVRYGSAGYVPAIPRLGIPPNFRRMRGSASRLRARAAVKRERTALPSGIATAATWNPDLAFKGGRMIGHEARASGFNVMLAGGVNLARDPRNGRNFEYGGEDPLLAGTIVGAEIAGIQSNHIISTTKHYALNDLEIGRKGHDAQIDPAAARMSDLLAFQLAMERGDPGSVMCSYNKVNGDFACENDWLLNRRAQDRLRFPRLCDERLGRDAQHGEGGAQRRRPAVRLAVRRQALFWIAAQGRGRRRPGAAGAARRHGAPGAASRCSRTAWSTIRFRKARRSISPRTRR